jgi:hypothetical protein
MVFTKQDKTTGNTPSENYHYIYLHENGELIGKSKHANPMDFEESDFVKKWWKMDLEWRGDAYNFLIGAKLKGGNPDTIAKWINDWKITNEDTVNYLNWVNLNWRLENEIYYVWEIEQDEKGESNTLFDALYDYVVKQKRR